MGQFGYFCLKKLYIVWFSGMNKEKFSYLKVDIKHHIRDLEGQPPHPFYQICPLFTISWALHDEVACVRFKNFAPYP